MKTPAVLALVFALMLTVVRGAEKPEYLQSFDPAKGFKPAQRDLTEIFLQIAGSLEVDGNPVPYLRHMAQEHARIEALYQRKNGKAPKSFRPAYMTDQYLDRLTANWSHLSPKLGLETFAKDVGNMMREAITGTRGTGTMLVEILNQHQANVFDAMVGKSKQNADFEDLRAQLISRLELDKTHIDDSTYTVPRRDAVRSALIVHGVTMKLFSKIDQGLKPVDAERVKVVITSVFVDVGEMAQSELQAGVSEWALGKTSTAAM